jgi:hypothetical protein
VPVDVTTQGGDLLYNRGWDIAGNMGGVPLSICSTLQSDIYDS